MWDTPTVPPRLLGCFRPILSGGVTLADGTYWLGPSTGRLLIKTGRAGLGRKAGHDLTIEATRWSGEAVIAAGDPNRSWVNVTVETDSLEVREATGGLKPLTDTDRAEIKRTLGDKALLHTAAHPTITFRSTGITGTAQSFEIDGELTIKGRTHPVTVHGKGDGDGLVRGWATVTQSTWGIKPYTAFLGALRLADDVRVEFDVARLEPANGPGC
ncbi:YceI family protein [Streptomyces sp. NWU339]|uniref:YceI family protein n=1 Tax=Streptomyces sp. NWU339 TaxID=2185284 RepID=UPI00215AB830|nr:YceI family protein [Streptomyces sp. NWU339]